MLAQNTRLQLKEVFDALRELMTLPDPPKRPIGFVINDKAWCNKSEVSRATAAGDTLSMSGVLI